jgi:hypothetical protein
MGVKPAIAMSRQSFGGAAKSHTKAAGISVDLWMMATAIQKRVSEREVKVRAKMATFIDHVIDTIETTPRRKAKAATPRAKRPAKVQRSV